MKILWCSVSVVKLLMRRVKALLIIVALVLLLASLLVLRSRRNKPVAANVSNTSAGPSFEVQVETPLFNRPPLEIPGVILGFSDRGPHFDQGSPGSKLGSVAPNRLELSAEDSGEIDGSFFSSSQPARMLNRVKLRSGRRAP